MADFSSKISEARKAGYSDDEILGHLSSSSPDLAPKIKEAQDSGYEPAEILAHLSPAQNTAAQQLGVTNPIAKGALDLVEGAGAGVLSTAKGVYDIGRKAGSYLLPQSVRKQALDATALPESLAQEPDSVMGKVGKYGEQAAEFALPMGMVSKATRGAGLLSRAGAEALASGGVAALQSGGDPGAAATGAAFGAVGPVLGAAAGSVARNVKIPQKLYQSALKPTWSMAKKQGLEMLDTGLREQIPVSSKGLEMVENRIKDIRSEINKGVQAKAASGDSIDTSRVLDRLTDLEDFYKNSAAPQSALDTLQGIRDEFQSFHGQKLPIDKAQQIKINTYQLLKKSYGEMAAAKVEGLKQVARGIKEEISNVFPEIADLNEHQSKLLGLDEALTRAVWRIENHQIMGIGSPLAAAGGHALAGGPGAIMGFAGKYLIDAPEIKSKLALALARAGVPRPTAAVAARLPMLQGALAKGLTAAATSDKPPEQAPEETQQTPPEAPEPNLQPPSPTMQTGAPQIPEAPPPSAPGVAQGAGQPVGQGGPVHVMLPNGKVGQFPSAEARDQWLQDTGYQIKK